MADIFNVDDDDDDYDDVYPMDEGVGAHADAGDDFVLEIPLLKSLEEDKSMGAATQKSVVKKLAKEGYAEGKKEQENMEMQEGFDEGFERGQRLGRLSGGLYGEIRAAYAKALLGSSSHEEGANGGNNHDRQVREMSDALVRLEKTLFYDFPQCMLSRSMEKDTGEYLFSSLGDKLKLDLIHIIKNERIDLFMQDLKTIC